MRRKTEIKNNISVSLTSAPDVRDALAQCESISQTVIAALRQYFGGGSPSPTQPDDLSARLQRIEECLSALTDGTPRPAAMSRTAKPADPFAGIDENTGW